MWTLLRARALDDVPARCHIRRELATSAWEALRQMGLIKQLFTWWDGQSAGTRLWTWRKGEIVGTDDQGNTYYRERGGKRRWVIYNGPVDASRVPAEWHGWLHNTVDLPPGEAAHPRKQYEKPHVANQTGGPNAYRPQGSILSTSERPRATGDYEAWSPDG